MASVLPPHFVPVTHFTTEPDDRDGLASDQEWEEEIEVSLRLRSSPSNRRVAIPATSQS